MCIVVASGQFGFGGYNGLNGDFRGYNALSGDFGGPTAFSGSLGVGSTNVRDPRQNRGTFFRNFIISQFTMSISLNVTKICDVGGVC